MTQAQQRVAKARAAGRPVSEHDAAIVVVEKALYQQNLEGFAFCFACRVNHLYRWGAVPHHADCYIPLLAFTVLRAEHWYERRWCPAGSPGERPFCHLILSDTGFEDGYIDCCQRPRGHDNGEHEPREGEHESARD